MFSFVDAVGGVVTGAVNIPDYVELPGNGASPNEVNSWPPVSKLPFGNPHSAALHIGPPMRSDA